MTRTLQAPMVLAALAFALALPPARADMKDDWIVVAHAAVASSGPATAQAQRSASLVHEVIERAGIAAHDGFGGTLQGNGAGARQTQRQAAAVAMAAFAVLEQLHPEARADLEVKLALSLEVLPENDAKAEGLVIGRRIAAEVLGLK